MQVSQSHTLVNSGEYTISLPVVQEYRIEVNHGDGAGNLSPMPLKGSL